MKQPAHSHVLGYKLKKNLEKMHPSKKINIMCRISYFDKPTTQTLLASYKEEIVNRSEQKNLSWILLSKTAVAKRSELSIDYEVMYRIHSLHICVVCPAVESWTITPGKTLTKIASL